MGRRYEASEWVEFLTEPGTPRVSTKRRATKFKNAVGRAFAAWAGHAAPVDMDMLAFKTFASIVGHGVGLWDGEVLPEAEGRAFERAVKRDSALVNLGHELDYEIMLDSER
jgi:hypothetical protein